MKKFFSIIIILLIIAGIGYFYAMNNKGLLLQKAVNVSDGVLRFSQLDDSTRAQYGVIQDLANALLVQDDVTRRYMVLMQNNLELRPGGGFLGQYATVEVRNGEILSYVIEDANLLDERYKSDQEAPLVFQQYTGIKKWKFRDSNFSPDFPENVEQARHFYGLAGEDTDFDGVFSINGTILSDVLEITGPISVPGREDLGAFEPETALITLEDAVEEKFARAERRAACEKAARARGESIGDCDRDENGKKLKKVTHADKVNRKQVLKDLGDIVITELARIENVPKLVELATQNLATKEIQLWFKDPALQAMAADAGWTGEVDTAWEGDYLMVVDANLGALKSDYHIERALEYTVDFTGRSAEVNDPNAGRMVRYLTPAIRAQVFAGTFVTQQPLATMRMTYTHTATEPSYRTSDYHSYTRLYAPEGSTWYIREWFEAPRVEQGVFGAKQSFGYKFDVLLGQTLPTMLQYTLPERITEDGYTLKVQKQSGSGTVPLTVNVIASDGTEYTKTIDFEKDVVFALEDGDGGKDLVVKE